MKEKKLKNFLWSTVGFLIYGFTSLFYMMIITRINGLEIAGLFTYAFANACIFSSIGSYSGKTYQVTENNTNFIDSDYMYHRLTSCLLMIAVSVLFCLITRPGTLKVILIIILTCYRSIDVFIDSIQAIAQRQGKLYQAGRSTFLRTVLLVFIFFIVDKLTHNIIVCSIAILITNIVFCCFVDFNIIKKAYVKNNYSKGKNIILFKEGFAVFLYSFLALYVLNASKYAINSYSNDEMQALFGIIIMPASFLALVSQYLIQPFLNIITNDIKNKNIKKLYKTIILIGVFLLTLGLIALLICYWLGIPILELLYGVVLKDQLKNLMIILIGSIFHSLVILLSAIFIALRKTIIQLILLIITAIFAFFSSNYLTYYFGIQGSSYAYLFITIVEFILHIVALIITLQIIKNKKEI